MIELSPDFFSFAYLIATILFIFGLKGLSSPKTALRGNLSAMVGMTIAIVVTLMSPEIKNYYGVLAGLGLGAFVGIVMALKISMTAMPQLVAILHSFVGLAAVLVAIGTILGPRSQRSTHLHLDDRTCHWEPHRRHHFLPDHSWPSANCRKF